MSKKGYRGGPSHTGWTPGRGATPSGGLSTAKWSEFFVKPAAHGAQRPPATPPQGRATPPK
jgi:hypothetical protein